METNNSEVEQNDGLIGERARMRATNTESLGRNEMQGEVSRLCLWLWDKLIQLLYSYLLHTQILTYEPCDRK